MNIEELQEDPDATRTAAPSFHSSSSSNFRLVQKPP